MELLLEPMRKEDVPGVKDLIADVVLELYGDVDFLPKTGPELLQHYGRIGYLKDIENFETEYGPGNGVFFVLRGAGGLCGCGGIRRIGSDQGELTRLWLRKDARKMGYGRKIFEALIQAAGQIGFREVYLDTSARCVDALRLFRANGFEDCPKYKESIGDIFLRKKLG